MRLVSLLHLALKAFIFAFGEQINKSDMIIQKSECKAELLRGTVSWNLTDLPRT